MGGPAIKAPLLLADFRLESPQGVVYKNQALDATGWRYAP